MMKRNYESTLETGYIELLTYLSEQPYEVFVISILPTLNNKYIDNDDIKAENIDIKRIVESFGFTFINAYDSLCDSDGNLISKYSIDGTHINNDGYDALWNVISHYIE